MRWSGAAASRLLVLAGCALWPVAARGQAVRSAPAFTGLAAGIELTRGSGWSFTEDIPELGRSDLHEIPASSGVGAHLSYAFRPDLALFGAGAVTVYGSELSGYNTFEGGIEARVPRFGARVLPFAQASVGRLHWSGRLSYTFAGLGAGAEVFLSERLALRLGASATWPLGDGRRDVGPQQAPAFRTARVDGALVRLGAGLAWHFLRRQPARNLSRRS